MLKNELEALSRWVTEAVSPSQLAGECKRIRRRWTAVLLSRVKDEVIRRYIALQQKDMAVITDELKCIHQPYLVAAVAELQGFLWKYFRPYLDPEIQIHEALYTEVTQKANALRATLERAEIGFALKNCLLHYVTETGEKINLTYRDAEYLFVLEDTIKAPPQRLPESLIMINFNKPEFCRWYREQLLLEFSKLPQRERLKRMKNELAAIRSWPLRNGLAAEQGLPEINAQMAAWLAAVIEQETQTAQKLTLNITVAQLALLTRLLLEEGFFASQNIAELLRFFSAHYMTRKQEHISYGSLNKLYYSGDQYTAFAIRAMLQKMINRTNKMFFPN